MKINVICNTIITFIIITSLGPETYKSLAKSVGATAASDNELLALVWQQEGTGCQNLANDSANNGGATFTCMGITQKTWENAIASKVINDQPINVKMAYDKDPQNFKYLATTIYKTQYLPACHGLSPLLTPICLATAVNFGPGVVPLRLESLNHSATDKEQATQWINANLADYQAICDRDKSKCTFLNGGWGNNIKNQRLYVENFGVNQDEQ